MNDSKHQHQSDVEALKRRADALLSELVELVAAFETLLRASNPVEIQGQLKAVGESVRKLTRQGIPVPDELRQLKITLATKESKAEEIKILQSRLVRELKEALNQLGSPVPILTAQPQPVRRGKKKTNPDEKVVDLFSWKTG